jgi:excisionase family DNA binding protein
MQVTESRRLLDVTQAARLLRVCPTTIRRKIARGELDAVRLGANGTYRVTQDAIDRFLRPASTLLATDPLLDEHPEHLPE